MKILAIESSGESCSVALTHDGTITQLLEHAPRQHTQRLLPMIDKLLEDSGVALSQLDAVAFGAGPGSFTGLRIATGLAQGLAFSQKIPTLPVSNLLALAHPYLTAETLEASSNEERSPVPTVLSAIDARMGEIYYTVYHQPYTDTEILVDALPEALIPPAVVNPNDLNDLKLVNWIGVGTGFLAYGDLIQKKAGSAPIEVHKMATPTAADIAEIALKQYAHGETVSATQAAPTYLRNQVTS